MSHSLRTLSALSFALIAVTVSTAAVRNILPNNSPLVPILPGGYTLTGQVGSAVNNPLFIPEDGYAIVKGDPQIDIHNIVQFETTSNPYITNDESLYNYTRFWIYEYTGNEVRDPLTGEMDMETADGQFFFSQAVLNEMPSLQHEDELDTFKEGRTYYIMSERDLRAHGEEGVSAAVKVRVTEEQHSTLNMEITQLPTPLLQFVIEGNGHKQLLDLQFDQVVYDREEGTTFRHDAITEVSLRMDANRDGFAETKLDIEQDHRNNSGPTSEIRLLDEVLVSHNIPTTFEVWAEAIDESLLEEGERYNQLSFFFPLIDGEDSGDNFYMNIEDSFERQYDPNWKINGTCTEANSYDDNDDPERYCYQELNTLDKYILTLNLPYSTCGNGEREGDEVCDGGEGCTEDCKAKDGYDCSDDGNCQMLFPSFPGLGDNDDDELSIGCTDSDEHLSDPAFYFNRGYVEGDGVFEWDDINKTNIPTDGPVYDYCEGNTVYERRCVPDCLFDPDNPAHCAFQNYKSCEHGCENGACLEESQSTSAPSSAGASVSDIISSSAPSSAPGNPSSVPSISSPPSSSAAMTSGPSIPTCSDSDNGNKFIEGTTTYGTASYKDACLELIPGQPKKLREYTCLGNSLSISDYNCQNGCVNGACLANTPGNQAACLDNPDFYWDQQSNTCKLERPVCTDPDAVGVGQVYTKAHTFGFRRQNAGPRDARIRTGGLDTCISNNIVREHQCSDTYFIEVQDTFCPNGTFCSGGKCVQLPSSGGSSSQGFSVISIPKSSAPSSSHQQQSSGPSGLCTDTENGALNKYVKGIVTTPNQSTPDVCQNNGTSVREYYCIAGTTSATYISKNCEYGCHDGACKTTPPASSAPSSAQQVTCSDTDGGHKPFTKGTATFGSAVRTDSCLNDSTVTEYNCEFGFMEGQNVSCQFGCENGACRLHLQQTCTDSDNGANFFIPGHVVDSHISTPFKDDCIGPNTLREGTCDADNKSKTIVTECTAGCNDSNPAGAVCNPPPPDTLTLNSIHLVTKDPPPGQVTVGQTIQVNYNKNFDGAVKFFYPNGGPHTTVHTVMHNKGTNVTHEIYNGSFSSPRMRMGERWRLCKVNATQQAFLCSYDVKVTEEEPDLGSDLIKLNGIKIVEKIVDGRKYPALQVSYDKGFDSCAHLYVKDDSLVQDRLIASGDLSMCEKGEGKQAVALLPPGAKPQVRGMDQAPNIGDQVKICNGNDWTQCSGFRTLTDPTDIIGNLEQLKNHSGIFSIKNAASYGIYGSQLHLTANDAFEGVGLELGGFRFTGSTGTNADISHLIFNVSAASVRLGTTFTIHNKAFQEQIGTCYPQYENGSSILTDFVSGKFLVLCVINKDKLKAVGYEPATAVLMGKAYSRLPSGLPAWLQVSLQNVTNKDNTDIRFDMSHIRATNAYGNQVHFAEASSSIIYSTKRSVVGP